MGKLYCIKGHYVEDFRAAIVGGGPRALSILERLVEYGSRIPYDQRLEVFVIDPGEFGEGAHNAEQARHLMINTLAAQITMYPPHGIIGGRAKPSFLHWVKDQGYNYFSEGYEIAVRPGGEPLSERHHLPRFLLGRYLSAFGSEVLAALSERVVVRHIRATAVDIEYDQDDYVVHLNRGEAITAQFVVLATGHLQRVSNDEDRKLAAFAMAGRSFNPNLAYVEAPYPVERLDTIDPSARVAVRGLGLTAHDVVSALTIGRGGRYRAADGRLVYERSGCEPRIWLGSRHTLPFAARGVNQKGQQGQYVCQFFTPQAARELRERAAKAGRAGIDFLSEVFPLIVKEMALAYRVAERGEDIDAATFEPTADDVRIVHEILWPLRDRTFRRPEDFHRWFIDAMKSDLQEAYRGNCASGLKAATDVLRDARDALRAALEFNGMSPTSHKYFIEEFNPIINRISFGPPLRRNEEWLALFEAGVLKVAGGSKTRVEMGNDWTYQICVDDGEYDEKTSVDVVIAARTDRYSPLTDGADLCRNLLARGIIRPFMNGDYHAGGIDIAQDMRVKDRNGIPQQRMWAVGFVVEGAHYYTNVLPRSGILSRQTVDADTIVLSICDAMQLLSQRRNGELQSAES
ncbi:FAD/NAD(P)-binding protein [Burkholderia cenocepacia]|uniref:FAD/NAD(P)-binding protein n=1 Tax=Burkholderia cenocepacia TaxID=95486 RepID=UPI0028660C04|nr:FAD/NAD(P)-binding protein [Burkholderia cenocepacia]MDR8050743.1 FAD/NAD(P)-binding protein [Burkholderia cenocepacia]MDV3097136.1 FAD/NAD(P)-binding protein [Burkholderia cenocepacia]